MKGIAPALTAPLQTFRPLETNRFQGHCPHPDIIGWQHLHRLHPTVLDVDDFLGLHTVMLTIFGIICLQVDDFLDVIPAMLTIFGTIFLQVDDFLSSTKQC